LTPWSASWMVRRHDIEEFAQVVERHGLVFRSQREYAERTYKQLQLAFDAAEKGEDAA